MILGIGTDIVRIDRMMQALSRHPQRFAARILSARELERFNRHAQPARFLAKRFAVKEAAAKALGTGIAQGVSWQHIDLEHDSLGAPRLCLTDRALALSQQQGVTAMHISLSDEKEYVVAFVVLSN